MSARNFNDLSSAMSPEAIARAEQLATKDRTIIELMYALKECAEVILNNSISDRRTANAYNNANSLIAKFEGGAE